MPKGIVQIGDRFGIRGQIEVIAEAGRRLYPSGESRRVIRYLCHDCGNEHDIEAGVIKKLNYCPVCREKRTELRKLPEYHAWSEMKCRCLNPKHQAYKNYGARGIKVCDEWLNSYEQFLEDMGRRPSDRHSLERRNNDLDYSKENCYWATIEEQNRNKRSVKKFMYKGKEHTIPELAKLAGVKYQTIHHHLRNGKKMNTILKDYGLL